MKAEAEVPVDVDVSELEAGHGAREERASGAYEKTTGDGPSGATPAGLRVRSRREPSRLPSVLEDLHVSKGVVVDGTYRIEGPLGAGGMGVVVLARDERLDRLVAIKLIRPELFEKDDLRELFVVEARAMARVNHPNVLAVHAFGELDRVPYFVMEYVDGESAEDWLARARDRGALPDLERALDIVDQACAGAAAIHAAMTVHRDLKPSNLLLDATGRVAVSDLGVARILEGREGGARCLVGSAAYMAPEAALGNDASPELAHLRDVYALGCIAYELLTGRPPFDGPTDMAIMAKQLTEAPPLPSRVRPDLPPGYDRVLLRALEKDPHARFESVAAFREALAQARTGSEEPTTILVADDDPDWRSILCTGLAAKFPGVIVDGYGDGESAIEAFEASPHSVVLVDLEMPEMDGMVLTRRLRALAASRRVPIIVLTAAGGPGEWRRLSQLGADAFLVKPANLEDVALLIRRAMKSRVAA